MDLHDVIFELSNKHEEYHLYSIEKKVSLAQEILVALQTMDWEESENWLNDCMNFENILPCDDIYRLQRETLKFVMGITIKNWLTSFINANSKINYIDPPKTFNEFKIYGPYSLGLDAPNITYELFADQSIDNSIEYNENCTIGKVSLVLGAGNQNFLSMIDILERVFVHSECVLFKHHPYRPFLFHPYDIILKPLIEKNIVSMIYDPGNDITKNIIKNDLIGHVHLTGSENTFNNVKSIVETKSSLIKCGVTGELGCITPWIVLPGYWTDNELNNAIKTIVSAKKANGGSNCLSPQIIIVPNTFNIKDFYNRLQKELQDQLTVPCYYPNCKIQRDELCKMYEDVRTIKTNNYTSCATEDDDVKIINISVLIDELNNHDSILKTEAFSSLLAIGQFNNCNILLEHYIDNIANFLNSDNIHGSLSCTILTPKSVDNIYVNELVSKLNYGVIAVNIWTVFGYGAAMFKGTWGAHYSENHSGRGRIGNLSHIHGVVKTVVWGGSLEKLNVDFTKKPPLMLIELLHVTMVKSNNIFNGIINVCNYILNKIKIFFIS